jgi:transposase
MTRLREAQLIGPDGQPTSLRDAAKYLGVSASTVWRALRKNTEES